MYIEQQTFYKQLFVNYASDSNLSWKPHLRSECENIVIYEFLHLRFILEWCIQLNVFTAANNLHFESRGQVLTYPVTESSMKP
jgi:hypothetical protein